jgi:hypothetical protein
LVVASALPFLGPVSASIPPRRFNWLRKVAAILAHFKVHRALFNVHTTVAGGGVPMLSMAEEIMVLSAGVNFRPILSSARSMKWILRVGGSCHPLGCEARSIPTPATMGTPKQSQFAIFIVFPHWHYLAERERRNR